MDIRHKDKKVASSSGGGASPGSSSSSTSRQQHRQRITRVNLRDFIFVLEQERTTSKSLLLYKALLNQTVVSLRPVLSRREPPCPSLTPTHPTSSSLQCLELPRHPLINFANRFLRLEAGGRAGFLLGRGCLALLVTAASHWSKN
ncbi:hypothetical protein CRUP_038716 [Coryphaenoides rupestris]|nr:hypothetical protein CRUP_038716 [Coryphaenoides rupestris]